VHNLDLRAFTLDAVSRGYVHRSWYLSGVEAGFEIWRDGTGLESRSFSVTVARGESPLSRTPAGPTGPAGPSAPGPACAVRWSTNVWSDGLLTSVSVTNSGPPARDWTVSWTFAGDERISTDWGVRTSQSGRRVVARSAAYNGDLRDGATATFGFQASHGGAPRPPTDVRLNGLPCAVS
jgi:Cellulose binding domain